MALAVVLDRDAPLGEMAKNPLFGTLYYKSGILRDPTSSVVGLLINIYQIENFCYSELNRSSRFKDTSKVKTLGPWAAALYQIIAGT